MNYNIKKFILICLIIFFFIFNSFLMYIGNESQTKINFSIYSNKNVSNLKGSKYYRLKMLLPQTNESTFISQIIPDSNMRFYFSPENYKAQNIYQDKFGNKILEMEWRNINSSTVEFNFNGLLEIKNGDYKFDDTVNDLRNNLSPDLLIYINESTDNVPLNVDEFNYLAKQFLKTSQNQFLIIFNLLRWIRKEIDFNGGYDNYNAENVLLNREGNREGIMHLILAILRSMSIPCRAVIAYSLPIERKYSKNIDVELKYEKGLYTLIEVYFPSYGWVPFDPFEYYIYPTRPYIKIGVSLDFVDMPYFNYETDIKTSKFFEDFAINIENINDNFLSSKSTISDNFESIIFIPDYIKNLFNDIVDIIIPKGALQFIKYDKKVSTNNIIIKNRNNYLEIPFENKNYYQPILFSKDIKIKRIDIPMIRLSGEGRIQIFIYKNINGEISKTPVLTSYYRSTTNISFGSNNLDELYVQFTFPENKLEAGEYYIVVRNILNTTYKGAYFGCNYIENRTYKNIFKIENNKIVYTNYNLIMNIIYE
ncbi:MAG: transglutaminase-like domain-containing protein [Spirochaetes bacterium]|nr:transglutaminase-like domain-containing protein [Spirochaetota bacterium]